MQPADDTEIFRQLKEGSTLFGPGWRWVDNFEEVDDDLEDDEEEEYVVMDLGTAMDSRTLQTEATYQLIGMDTPMPFLKIGEHVFQGTVAPLIGDEVILDVVRQEDDPQRPRHRPAYRTRNRVELRGVNLTLRGAQTAPPPKQPAKVDPAAAVRSFFPQRNRWKGKVENGDEEMDVDVDAEEEAAGPTTPYRPANNFTGAEPSRPSGLRNSVAMSVGSADDDEVDAALALQTPGPASGAQTPATPAAGRTQTQAQTPTQTLTTHSHPLAQSTTGASAEPTPNSSARGANRRPRGSRSRASRASLPVSTMTDLADINHAGGLGDVRLEIADDATPELLAAVTAITGKPGGPGARLSRAQEERLVRGLPASGPGSRGGRGGRGRGGTLSGRARGRPRGRGSMVNPAGVGLADGFLGIVGDQEWEYEGGDAGPSGTSPRREDSEDELREIGDDEE